MADRPQNYILVSEASSGVSSLLQWHAGSVQQHVSMDGYSFEPPVIQKEVKQG